MIALSDLRLQIETDLPDASLQLVLSGVDEELTSRFGSASPVTETFMGYYPRYLFLRRKAASLTSVTERESDGTTTLLDISGTSTSDARMTGEGRMIERLATGTYPRTSWAPEVTVVYASADQNRRDLAIVKLVKLELAYTGMASEKVGSDYSMTAFDYEAEKEKIINGLKQWGLA